MTRKNMVFWFLVGLIGAWILILIYSHSAAAASPVIDNVEIFNYRDLDTPVTEFVIGDDALLIVDITDADLDATWILVRQYLLPMTTPYSGDEWYPIDQETISEAFDTDVEILGPAGEWRIDFQAEDVEGDKSEIYSVFIDIYAVELPEPDSGGGDGGGPCFIGAAHGDN